MGNEKNQSMASVASSDVDEPDRGKWGSPAEFILSCLGYAVGLGNVWRFPYMAYQNGGGAFLIPYFIMLTFVGIPVFFIELAVGQYSGSGPATVWEAAPLFRGVGFGMIAISFIGSIYYNLIIAWSLYYLFAGFQSVLPWVGCTNDFNTEKCYSKSEASDCEGGNGTWFNQTCYNATYISSFDVEGPEVCNVTMTNVTMANVTDCYNSTLNSLQDYLDNVTQLRISSSEEYFNWKMLDRSDTINDTGYMKWDLALVLLLAWIMCFLCILKGIRSSGKVVYFTATFPYLLLVILFFRAVLLDNAGAGVLYYIVPKWEELAKPKVWADAAGQIFFSLSVGGGGLMTFASYNKFNNNIYRDTLIVAIGNCLTSFFAGFVIFSILGFMAAELNTTVDKVAASGSGLAFIAYPDIVSRLPAPQFWSFLFFFMLLTLGLDSQFASLENVQTAITDTWPQTRKYKWVVALSLCSGMYILGLTQVTQAGVYWTELMSYYSSGWSLVLMGAIEGIVFPWVYGADRLMDDIEAMVGFRLGKHWYICWKFITPLLLIVVLIVNFIDFTPLSYGDYVLEPWAQGLGWMMAMVTVVFIPICAAYVLWQSYKLDKFDDLSFAQRVLALCKPTEKWRPANEKEKGSMEDIVSSDPEKRGSRLNPAYDASDPNLAESGRY